MNCSDLVWTCKGCGHSCHAEEWQSHGRQCPVCTEKRGEWKCSLCLGAFTQPALQGPHPCKKAAAACVLTSSSAPSEQRTITLPGWLNFRNTTFLLSGLAVLGLAYFFTSIKVTQIRQDKSQKLSALFAGAQQSLASGNYDKAISLYREMEALSVAMPDWSFSTKNGLSRALGKAGRTEEARSKLGEVEMILKKNPDILKGQDLQGAIDFTRREIESSEIINDQNDRAFALLKKTKAYQDFLKGYEESLLKNNLKWHPLFTLETPDLVVVEIRTDLGDRTFPHRVFKVNLSTKECYEWDVAADKLIEIK